MARIQKYHTGIKKVIQHNIREFKDGKCPTNLEVNPEKTKYNYSLIRRGNTAAEIEAYRKRITKAFHTIYKIIIPIALLGLWMLLLLTNIRDKTYLYKTGRKYRYDSTHYKRSYQELVTYFQDADPLRMKVEDLPTMKCQDSGGLIFGKVGNKLLSFEPNTNGGIVSMV